MSLFPQSHFMFKLFTNNKHKREKKSQQNAPKHLCFVYNFAATTSAPTHNSMGSDMKATSKNNNLIVLGLDSWPQAGCRGHGTERGISDVEKVFGRDTQA